MEGVLRDILVVLVAAKLAAEAAERVHVPAVVGEIVAGVIVGPSLLGWVHGGDILRVLAELGVILLLLEVGLQMDVTGLAAVGRASLMVATVGVALPFAGGYVAGAALGLSADATLFTAAALTATSVGITARVFGDLRALATVEARTVLGAAVADDVMGLVILTVVVRVVGGGSVSPVGVGAVVAIALLFLVSTTAVGVSVAPRLFAGIDRYARSPGTVVALALAFTLAFAELAQAAELAPIVGAFVAGLALSRGTAAVRIQRELTPVGHLFVPVFFLQIGIDTEIRQLLEPRVLAIAGVLVAVGVAGKVAAGLAVLGAPGDKLLIGLGMIPRGEVGLIFAGIGLRSGVLGPDVYAALLLMVLVTTLLSPPLLRWQLLRVQRGRAGPATADHEPAGGWLVIEDGVVELAAAPPPEEALHVALLAARHVDHHRPGSRLTDWLAASTPDEPAWDLRARAGLFELLKSGGGRAWRFLEATGVLERAMPELSAALRRRAADPLLLDPGGLLRWELLEQVRVLPESADLEHQDLLLLAALMVDATERSMERGRVVRQVAVRLGLDPAEEELAVTLVTDDGLLPAVAARPDALAEDTVLQLAAHLGSAERVRALWLLALAADGMEPWEEQRLGALVELVLASLGRAEARSVVEQRRERALALVPAGSPIAARVLHAPRSYLLAEDAARVARHAALVEPLPSKGRFRVAVTPVEDAPGCWSVDVAARDQLGLLATVTDVLDRAGMAVHDATVAAWPDGGVIEAFRVTAPRQPVADAIRSDIEAAARLPLESPAMPGVTLTFDDAGSPWYTLCHVSGTDRPGLLHALAAAFASAGADVHSARVTTIDDVAVDQFELTDRNSRKLDGATQDAIRLALVSGVRSRRRPWR